MARYFRPAVLLIGLSMGPGQVALAQSFDGEWRGSGKCAGTSASYKIVLSVQNNNVSGDAQSSGGKSDAISNLRGQVDSVSGAVTLRAGTNRITGSVSGRRMTIKGWTGEATCEFALDQASAPNTPSIAVAPPPAPSPVTAVPMRTAQAPLAPPAVRPIVAANPQRDAFLTLAPAEMSDVQTSLQQLGHYQGSVDGAYGPGTEAAIRAWQQTLGLPQTGYLSSAQIFSLIRRQAVASAEKKLPDSVGAGPGLRLSEVGPRPPSSGPDTIVQPSTPRAQSPLNPVAPSASPPVPALLAQPPQSAAVPQTLPATQSEVERLRKQVAEAEDQARRAKEALAEATRRQSEDLERGARAPEKPAKPKETQNEQWELISQLVPYMLILSLLGAVIALAFVAGRLKRGSAKVEAGHASQLDSGVTENASRSSVYTRDPDARALRQFTGDKATGSAKQDHQSKTSVSEGPTLPEAITSNGAVSVHEVSKAALNPNEDDSNQSEPSSTKTAHANPQKTIGALTTPSASITADIETGFFISASAPEIGASARPSPPLFLHDIPLVTATNWAEKIGAAEKTGSAIVIFYTSSFSETPLFRHFFETLTRQILPFTGQHRLYRFALDTQPKFATKLLRNIKIRTVTVQDAGILWSGNGTLYTLGDRAFASRDVLDQSLRALCINREVELPAESPLKIPVPTLDQSVSANSTTPVSIPPKSGAQQARQLLIWVGYICGAMAFIFWPIILGPAGIIIGAVISRRGETGHGQKQMGLGLIGLIGGLLIWMLSGGSNSDPGYVNECRSLWDRQSRGYPAVDVAYRRVGNGEMTRHTDDRLVGYYTDFIITLKFDNFGKQGRINLQCVANSQKTFVYMKTDDPDWIGGNPGPAGVTFIRADGTYSIRPPDLE